MAGKELSLELVDVEICVVWNKFWTGGWKDEIIVGHAVPYTQCCDNEEISSLQIRMGFSPLLLEKAGKYICATRKGLCSVRSPFSEPLASAQMKKITPLLNCNTKGRFMASSSLCACRLTCFTDRDATCTISFCIS